MHEGAIAAYVTGQQQNPLQSPFLQQRRVALELPLCDHLLAQQEPPRLAMGDQHQITGLGFGQPGGDLQQGRSVGSQSADGAGGRSAAGQQVRIRQARRQHHQGRRQGAATAAARLRCGSSGGGWRVGHDRTNHLLIQI